MLLCSLLLMPHKCLNYYDILMLGKCLNDYDSES